jgi:hypothetical protein
MFRLNKKYFIEELQRYESFIGEDWWKEDTFQIISNLIGEPLDPRIPFPNIIEDILK